MNQNPGIIGRKLGMTQLFTDDGTVVRCTVIESALTVVGKRTQEKDGYDALIVGLGERAERHTTKPVAGQFKKINMSPKRTVRELRMAADLVAKYEVGAAVKLSRPDEISSLAASNAAMSRSAAAAASRSNCSPSASAAAWPRSSA